MESASLIIGLFLSLVAGVFLGTFAWPMKRISKWKWENIWIMYSYGYHVVWWRCLVWNRGHEPGQAGSIHRLAGHSKYGCPERQRGWNFLRRMEGRRKKTFHNHVVRLNASGCWHIGYFQGWLTLNSLMRTEMLSEVRLLLRMLV